jgi:hypothetical protein
LVRQRIAVTGCGITLTSTVPPLVSPFGTEVRPATISVVDLPWNEIHSISVSSSELPPDGSRWTSLTINASWGEFCEVHEHADGYAESVAALCRLSGLPIPEKETLATSGQVIWPAPEPA